MEVGFGVDEDWEEERTELERVDGIEVVGAVEEGCSVI